jgi:hypothetical protein
MISEKMVFSTRLLTPALILFLILQSNSALAQLSEPVRTNFTSAFFKNCYTIQRGASQNNGTSDVNLKKYCDCVSNNVADGLTNTLVIEIEKGNIPQTVITSGIQTAANYCTKKMNSSQFK